MADGQGGRDRPRAGGLARACGVAFLMAAAAAAVVAFVEVNASDLSARAVKAHDNDGESDAGEAVGRRGWGVGSGNVSELAAARALLLEPPNLDAAEAHTWDALRRSPARAGAWARLAYIDVERDGRLDAAGREALARSYRVSPYAGEALRRWRTEFTLSRWSEVDDELRQAALREARGATAGGARWYEESLWMWELADRLAPEARDALLAATSRIR